MILKKSELYLFLAFLLALVSVAGSLFFSEFMNLPPCDLCWYQRIFMYPLVVIFWVGFSRQDRENHLYSLPFILGGLATAIYHNLLYYKWITPKITPCSSGVSCTQRQLDLLGFISIPLMSLVVFILIFAFVFLHLSQQKRNSNP